MSAACEAEDFGAALKTSADDPSLDLPASRPTVAYAAKIAQLGLRGFLQHACDQGAGFSTLSLAENAIGDAGVQVLCDVMSGNPFLRRLNLHDTGIGHNGFEKLGGLLQACPQIEVLVLSGNRPGDAPLPDAFCSAVAAAPALRALQLSSCGLDEACLRPLFEALCKRNLCGLAPLERLTLSRNRIAGLKAAELCGVLAASGVLEGLDLSANSLGPAGGEALAQRLHGVESCGLRRLSVDANGLELRGCRALVRLWNSPSGPSLEHLDLRENGLSEGNCTELSRMLGKELGSVLQLGGGRRVMLSWRDRQAVMSRKAHGGHEPMNIYWHDRD